jgi:uncharacterized protein
MIKRSIFPKLLKHLTQPEISLITGSRQAGKTTLMLLLKDHLEKTGAKTLFLNLDVENDRRFFSSQETLISKIRLELGNAKGFVFIDEIQRKENAGLFLKGIYDMNLPYKFIVSGSGSLELKEKIHESLAGRKRVFEVETVSFEEFVNYRTEYKYENRMKDFFSLETEKTRLILSEYLAFGGYPKVILAPDKAEKIKTLEEIYQSYIIKDISFLLGVEKTDAFSNLVKILASQNGKLVNLTEFSQTLGIALPTIKTYLWYLENTFIINKITPFHKNTRKEITKAPLYYFCDIGLKNFALSSFDEFANGGFNFQNLIYKILKEKMTYCPSSKIQFWRTKDGSEVDFILEKTQKPVPYEVKYSRIKEAKISRSIKSFINKYRPESVYIVNLSLDSITQWEDSKICFIPFYLI